MYEQHPFWCTGYTFWELHNEAPDLFLHLSRSDLVFFKGDLNHRKLTYDCAAPPSTDFEIAIGPMASAAGAPKVCSLRTIKSDVVVGLGPDGDELAEKLDKEEPGWKISGKYVRALSLPCMPARLEVLTAPALTGCRPPIRGPPRREGHLHVRRSRAAEWRSLARTVYDIELLAALCGVPLGKLRCLLFASRPVVSFMCNTLLVVLYLYLPFL